ncbi:hypothetical protein AB1K32_19540 [Metabacillus dongyingensis]
MGWLREKVVFRKSISIQTASPIEEMPPLAIHEVQKSALHHRE